MTTITKYENMKTKALNGIGAIGLVVLLACSPNNKTANSQEVEKVKPSIKKVKVPSHRYGGWYCPDNLKGFPPVNLADWRDVPVINGRLATKEETQTEASLILVDTEKYPNAKPLDIKMPRLATFQSPYSKREELIIVIQALNIDNDSVVGFRYLNGGNGSARLDEITLISDEETTNLEEAKFYTQTVSIDASADVVKKILIKPENVIQFQSILEKSLPLKSNWRNTTNVNYHYPHAGKLTATYADDLFGNYYVQNDYSQSNFTEKFLVLSKEDSSTTELQIMCGPFIEDYDTQKLLLDNWVKQLKVLSENG
jgi:hypothetical protein